MVLVKSSLPAAIVSSTSCQTAGDIFSQTIFYQCGHHPPPPPGPVEDNLKKPTHRKKGEQVRVTCLTAPQRPSCSINSQRLNCTIGILWIQAAQKSTVD